MGSLFRQQKVFEVVVRATPEARNSVTDIRRLLIDTPGGGHVRLGDVATVRVRPTPAVIQREASRSRRIDVTADVRGRGLQAVKGEVTDRIRRASFPLEYHAQVIGDSRGDKATAARVLGASVAAAVGVFLLLQAAFGSWRLAALAFLTLPVALLGGEIAGLIDGTTFSLGAIAACSPCSGSRCATGIVLIGHLQRQEEREGAYVRTALAGAHPRTTGSGRS